MAVLLCVGASNVWAYDIPEGKVIRNVFIGTPVYTDEVITSVTAEDFEGTPDLTGWSSPSSACGSHSPALAVRSITTVDCPAVETTVSSGYPTYVSGKAITAHSKNSSTDLVYTLPQVITSGRIVFSGDIWAGATSTIGGENGLDCVRFRLLDEDGNDLFNLGFNNGNTTFFQNGTTNIYDTEGPTAWRSTPRNEYLGWGFHDMEINVETGTVTFMLDFIDNNNTRRQRHFSVSIGTGKRVAKLLFHKDKRNYELTTSVDNVQLFYVDDPIPAGEKTYSIKAKVGDKVLKTLKNGSAAEGADVTINGLNWAIQVGGKWYKLNDANVSNFSRTFEKGSSDNEELAVSYVLDENIVYYTEAEALSGWYNQDQKADISSGGMSRFLGGGNSTNTSFSIAAGYYNVVLTYYRRGNGNGNVSNTDIYVKGTTDTKIGRIDGWGIYNTPNVKTIQNVYIPAGSEIKILEASGSNSTVCFDYIHLTKADATLVAAIEDCKSYETSDAFATYINAKFAAGELTTTAEVYAAHTAWQVAQAKASHSTDYSKVILNHAVTSTDKYWGTLSDGASAPYEGAPDNYYLYNAEGEAYNVNNTVYGIPAGKYEVSAYTYSSSADVRNLYVAIADPWQDIQESNTTSAAGWVKNTTPIELSAQNNLAFGFYAGAITGRTAGFDNWTLTLTGEQVSVSSAGYATYVSSYDLNFSETSIKAYKVKVNTKGIATLTKVDNVPAGTPVLLYKEGGATEFIPVMTGADEVTGNDLVAGTGAAVATTDGDYTNMILWTNATNPIGFYFAAGQTVAANRAYLHIADDMAPDAVGGASPSRMVMVFADDETTGVQNLTPALSEGEGVVYNLRGQRVAQPTKGLYIVNGKKVVIK